MIGLTQQEIENKIRGFETRIANLEAYKNKFETKITNLEVYKNKLEADTLWKLRQQVEGNYNIIENLRSSLNPLLEKAVWDNGYVNDMVVAIDELPYRLEEIQAIENANNDDLQTQMNALQNIINTISINADTVGMTLKELSERLSQLTPAEDAQENRSQELEGDLEIFDENDWIFNDPIKICDNDEGREVWY